jgi:hypothetical protein
MADEAKEILNALGLDKPIPTQGMGPVSPDVLRAEMAGPAPAGLDALKEGMMAFMYILAQTVATTPPYDELTEAALDIMKRIGKVIDVNEALIKSQVVLGELGKPAVGVAGPTIGPTPSPSGPGPTEGAGAPTLEGIEI